MQEEKHLHNNNNNMINTLNYIINNLFFLLISYENNDTKVQNFNLFI